MTIRNILPNLGSEPNSFSRCAP